MERGGGCGRAGSVGKGSGNVRKSYVHTVTENPSSLCSLSDGQVTVAEPALHVLL